MKNKRYIITFLLFIIICTLSCSKPNAQKNEAKRIISLSPAGTEILFALDVGDKIIARTDFCNYPEEALSITSIGGFDGKEISDEKIIALNPDFVCLTKGMHEYIVNTLNMAGISYFFLDSTDFNDVFTAITELSKFTGTQETGENLVKNIKDEINKFTAKTSNNKKSVYFEISEKPYFTCGGKSFISQIISCAGGKNIFEEVETPYPIVSEESIIAKRPEVIIIPLYNLSLDTNLAKKTICQRDGWSEIPAIKNNKIFFVNADIIERPGPRICLAINEIYKVLYEN